jgi:hypothetical protein
MEVNRGVSIELSEPYAEVEWFQHRNFCGTGVADFCGFLGGRRGWVFCMGRFWLWRPVKGGTTGVWARSSRITTPSQREQRRGHCRKRVKLARRTIKELTIERLR